MTSRPGDRPLELLPRHRGEQSPFEAVDSADVLKEVLGNLRSSIDVSATEVSWGELPTVFGHRSQLVQLFQNLIGNAILYRSTRPPRIRIEAEPRSDHWQFTVEDNGIGVAPEHHERIFEIFKRLHARHEYPGTGIGLAVCRKIVERHGGRIWVESRVGEGSVFHFTFPARLEDESTESQELQLAAIAID